MVCLIFLSLGFLIETAVGDQCYQDWLYYEGSCYGFGEEKLTWPDSEEVCRTFQSKLVEIETSEENEWLKSMARMRQADDYWLGGTDLFHEGNWEWASTRESIYPFSDWYPGEPSDGGGHEDCLGMRKVMDYRWNDYLCDYLNDFICEATFETVLARGFGPFGRTGAARRATDLRMGGPPPPLPPKL